MQRDSSGAHKGLSANWICPTANCRAKNAGVLIRCRKKCGGRNPRADEKNALSRARAAAIKVTRSFAQKMKKRLLTAWICSWCGRMIDRGIRACKGPGCKEKHPHLHFILDIMKYHNRAGPSKIIAATMKAVRRTTRRSLRSAAVSTLTVALRGRLATYARTAFTDAASAIIIARGAIGAPISPASPDFSQLYIPKGDGLERTAKAVFKDTAAAIAFRAITSRAGASPVGVLGSPSSMLLARALRGAATIGLTKAASVILRSVDLASARTRGTRPCACGSSHPNGKRHCPDGLGSHPALHILREINAAWARNRRAMRREGVVAACHAAKAAGGVVSGTIARASGPARGVTSTRKNPTVASVATIAGVTTTPAAAGVAAPAHPHPHASKLIPSQGLNFHAAPTPEALARAEDIWRRALEDQPTSEALRKEEDELIRKFHGPLYIKRGQQLSNEASDELIAERGLTRVSDGPVTKRQVSNRVLVQGNIDVRQAFMYLLSSQPGGRVGFCSVPHCSAPYTICHVDHVDAELKRRGIGGCTPNLLVKEARANRLADGNFNFQLVCPVHHIHKTYPHGTGNYPLTQKVREATNVYQAWKKNEKYCPYPHCFHPHLTCDATTAHFFHGDHLLGRLSGVSSRNSKIDDLSTLAYAGKLDELRGEFRKCVLLHATCHAHRTYVQQQLGDHDYIFRIMAEYIASKPNLREIAIEEGYEAHVLPYLTPDRAALLPPRADGATLLPPRADGAALLPPRADGAALIPYRAAILAAGVASCAFRGGCVDYTGRYIPINRSDTGHGLGCQCAIRGGHHDHFGRYIPVKRLYPNRSQPPSKRARADKSSRRK